MLRGIERNIRRAKDFLSQENNMVVAGAYIMGGLTLATLHLNGFSQEWSNAAISAVTPPGFKHFDAFSGIGELYINIAGSLAGYFYGGLLTRKAIIWEESLRFSS